MAQVHPGPDQVQVVRHGSVLGRRRESCGRRRGRRRRGRRHPEEAQEGDVQEIDVVAEAASQAVLKLHRQLTGAGKALHKHGKVGSVTLRSLIPGQAARSGRFCRIFPAAIFSLFAFSLFLKSLVKQQHTEKVKEKEREKQNKPSRIFLVRFGAKFKT